MVIARAEVDCWRRWGYGRRWAVLMVFNEYRKTRLRGQQKIHFDNESVLQGLIMEFTLGQMDERTDGHI